jgi:hypothetical protein
MIGLRSPLWLFSAGVSLVYLASLSVIFVQETERPSPLVIGLFGSSLVAGAALRRFSMLLLSAGVVAVLLAWFGVLDEDLPLVAVVGGLLVGTATVRAYERAFAPPAHRDAPARRWPLLKRVLRPIVTKQTFEATDDVIDRVRFRIDTLPNGLYQPVPGVPARAARAPSRAGRRCFR